VITIRSILDAQLAHRALRCRAGLTQAQLGKKLHVAADTVFNREGGYSGFGVDALAALGDVFGYDLVLLPRRGGTEECCEHCRAVTKALDERLAIRRHQSIPTPFAALYDAIAKAMGRRA